VNETWTATARYLTRYRGALLGGIGSAVAVAMTLDPSTGLASSSVRFAFWFAMVATALAVALTGVLAVAEYRASRPALPKATVHRPKF
jgi:hypothetical protein